jgi:phage tail sheath protein FI
VQRAPGNLAIRGISHVSRSFDDTDHGELNAENVNVLRVEFGRAPMIGGARTLSHDPDWKFVNIVRMMLALKKSIDVALRWVVFEPNDSSTRMAVAATIDTLLRTFWLRGAFAGATPEESYFIRCDDTSTTSTDRDEGRLIAYVGIAPAVPLEFIILRVGQEANALSVTVLESQGVA